MIKYITELYIEMVKRFYLMDAIRKAKTISMARNGIKLVVMSTDGVFDRVDRGRKIALLLNKQYMCVSREAFNHIRLKGKTWVNAIDSAAKVVQYKENVKSK